MLPNQWCGPAWRHQRLDNRQEMSRWMGPVIWIPEIGISLAIYGRALFLPKARRSAPIPPMSLRDLHITETPHGQFLFSAWKLWRFLSPLPRQTPCQLLAQWTPTSRTCLSAGQEWRCLSGLGPVDYVQFVRPHWGGYVPFPTPVPTLRTIISRIEDKS